MELFRDTHIDFMKYRKFWIIISRVLVLGGLYAIFGPHQLNLGIDFAGGTQITLGFNQPPDLDRLRRRARARGDEGGGDPALRQGDGQPGHHQDRGHPEAPRTGAATGSSPRSTASSTRASPGSTSTRPAPTPLGAFLLANDPDQFGRRDPAAARAHYAGVADAILDERARQRPVQVARRPRQDPGREPGGRRPLQQQATLGTFYVLASRTSARRSAASCATRASWRW